MVLPPKKRAWMQNFADLEAIRHKVMIYPADTAYALGCNAEEDIHVERIFALKDIISRRKPLPVIAPGKGWILENCVVSEELLDRYLPGRYSLILQKKNPNFLNLATTGLPTIGVRIPATRIAKLVEDAGVPFIATVANKFGGPAPKILSEVPEEIRKGVDLIVENGELAGELSTLVDCTGTVETIIARV
ncbi:Threonylcarbamoyl-AMP synthase [uncultured archaeon]|nr:Threonylcarbamoyl-AMP synthase [uncultured archaeon]